MNSRTIYLATLLLVKISGMAAASDGTDGIETELQAEDLAIVQAGEVVYQAQCAVCHGKNLEGQPNWQTRDTNGYLPAPPHDANGHTWHHADDLLFEIVKFGPAVVIGDDSYKTLMPAYENLLSDDEIIAVLSYIKNSWPEEQRSWQDEVNGTPKNGLNASSKKKSLIEKILK